MQKHFVAILQWPHQKFGYQQDLNDGLTFAILNQTYLNQSTNFQIAHYSFSEALTENPGIQGLIDHDSYYEDIKWFNTFNEFQTATDRALTLTTNDLANYYYYHYQISGQTLNQLVNHVAKQLTIPVANQYQLNVDMRSNDTIAQLHLLDKLSGRDNFKTLWQIITNAKPASVTVNA